MLASFFDKDGQPLGAHLNTLWQRHANAFREVTGMEFQSMGELEYYVITPDDGTFPAVDQKGYHESAPSLRRQISAQNVCTIVQSRRTDQIWPL